MTENHALGLDISSTATGYVCVDGSAVVFRGTSRRKKDESVCDYAARTASEVKEATWSAGLDLGDIAIVYERNTRRLPPQKTKAVLTSAVAWGRVLQALGVEGTPIVPDTLTKTERAQVGLVYGAQPSELTEHEADALSVVHKHLSDPRLLCEVEESAEPEPAKPTASSVVDAWNAAVEELDLPRVRKLTDERVRKINAQLRKGLWDEWPDIVKELGQLRGFAYEGKWLSFDWILSETNRAKLLEGNYRAKQPASWIPASSSYADQTPQPD